MPTITLNRKVFEKLIGKKLKDEELKEKIPMLGTDLESVKKNEIVVEIFPNRPDMLSEQGFSRAFASFIGTKPGLRTYKSEPSKEKIKIEKSVFKVRPRTSCAIIKNIKFANEKIKEVIQIQEKLHTTFGRNRKKCAIGIYPLEKIKFPITYKAIAPEKIKFVPLEYKRELTGAQILERHPTGKAYAHLLEGEKLYPVFVDANNQILSMPPIINSQTVGKITEQTKDIFIEASGFDQETLDKVMNILVCMFADMGGDIYSLTLMYGNSRRETPSLKIKELELDPGYVNKILGLNLKENTMIALLRKMGFDASKEKKVLKVKIPAYRADVMHPIDFVEDIAVAYGIDKFKEEIPNVSTIGEESPVNAFVNKLASGLVGLNLMEVNSLHLTNEEKNFKKMNLKPRSFVVLENALTADYDALRSWLLPNFMKIFSENTNEKYPQKIFEIGRTFELQKNNVNEEFKLAVGIAGPDTNFTEIKSILEGIFKLMDKKVKTIYKDHDSFIPGRSAAVVYKGKDIGIIGELHPDVILNWNLETPVTAFEINTELLI